MTHVGDMKTHQYRKVRCIGSGTSSRVYLYELVENCEDVEEKSLLVQMQGAVPRYMCRKRYYGEKAPRYWREMGRGGIQQNETMHEESTQETANDGGIQDNQTTEDADLETEDDHDQAASVPNLVPHENLIHIFRSTLEHMIYEYCPWTLESYIQRSLSLQCKKDLMMQILRGVHHLHAHGWMHRDLKPSNIFITEEGTVKLGDFDLLERTATILRDGSRTPAQTLNFQALELLFGETHYGPAVDMWSLGGIFFEIFTGGWYLFDAEGQIAQISQVFDLLGAPTAENWPQMTRYKTASRFSFSGRDSLQERIEAACKTLLDEQRLESSDILQFTNLLRHLLCYNFEQRITAEQAMQHEFFSRKRTRQDSQADNEDQSTPKRQRIE